MIKKHKKKVEYEVLYFFRSNSNKQFGINIKTTALENSLKEEIIFYNQKRKMQLNKNLKSEIIKDYKDEKTIWINKTLYTYAELNTPGVKTTIFLFALELKDASLKHLYN